MNIVSYRLVLALVGFVGILLALRLALRPLVGVNLITAEDVGAATTTANVVPKTTGDSVAAIAAHDPFRIGHRPALPAYDPLRLSEQLAPPPARPTLEVVGIMEGVEPSAVIEGLPGVEGARVVRVGDVIGSFTVKTVGVGRVVITGLDTTWVLEVREPWKNGRQQ